MQNPNHIRVSDNILEEDKFHNEGLISFIENDYVLNFINEHEPGQRRSMPATNTFNPLIGDMSMPFTNFTEAPKNPESFPNIYGRLNIQDAWFLQNMNEVGKAHQLVPRPVGAKVDNNQDLDGGIKTKKIKLEKDQLVRKAIDVTSSKGKNNIKNTYINKINSLINEPKPSLKSEENKSADLLNKVELKKPILIKNEVENQNVVAANAAGIQKGGMKKVRSYDVLKSDEIEKLNVKLARNRESARNSRKRKKVYIDLLEKKVSQLQQELNGARKQLELNSTSFTKLCGQSKLMNSLYSGKQQLFDKLDKMVSNKNDEAEISLLIDSLRFRMGATGKERTSAINFFFKQIIEFLVPVHMKYLLLTAAQGKDLFSTKDTTLINSVPAGVMGKNDLQNETTEYWTELLNQVNLTDQQKKAMLKYRKKLTAEKQKFEGLINSLNQVRKSLLKESSSLQDIIDEFRNILSPIQTGKFLLILDKERNRKEFSSEKLWNSVFTKKESEDKDGSEDSDNFYEDVENPLQDEGGEQNEIAIEGDLK